MTKTWPDIADFQKREPVLCPDCLIKTSFAMNTERYVCPVHGPVVTVEQIYRQQGSRN